MFDGLEPRRNARAPLVWLLAALLCAPVALLGIYVIDQPLAQFSHTALGQPRLARWLTQLARGEVLIGVLVLGALSMSFSSRTVRFGRAFGTAAIAVILALLLTVGLKFLFGRTWPETWVDNNPSFIRDQVYGFFWMHGGIGYSSFPSGHTARAVAPFAVLGLRLPALRPLCYAVPILVALGLLGANFHFFSDCVAGCGVGLLCAFIAQSIAPRLRLG